MKKIKLLALTAAVAGSLAGVSGTAVAGASANIGFVSDYYFRGAVQSDATASAGLDYEHDSGAFVGVWAADVGGHGAASASAGIEYDIYAGYSGEASGVAYTVAYNTYNYTGDFDTYYGELYLSAGYGPVTVEFATGTHEDDSNVSTQDADFTFMAITGEYKDLSLTFGSWGDDMDGDYLELAYGTTVSDIDLGVSIINGDATTTAGKNNIVTDGTAMVFSVGYAFDL
ncbi:MAG: TorF family putative porin [Gammaproteobacteria bacterium]|nr:TorF family putative porin [Gammaproteobacteria bacterium]